ncbi:hypothetical protein [Pseudoalteromonas phenolica]|uniref:Lipoprotein n=1 Tax=Pseudoalteromonas phenolica TaxID=161398 RepID=A0A0S2K4B1_9GAMM|nr:hypothetical protein [Pseudoalteromonas phenolica]ALO43065.1 hypothetical protein PP2015_2576 [Pseudoalteromonas phenolica]MBE0355785.1 hypothetical protein [Pseudoalteromonas phenolica O-BC30]
MRKVFYALSALAVTLLSGCGDSNKGSSKPTSGSGTNGTQVANTTELDRKLFSQIKLAGEHVTPWRGYAFKSVPLYFVHSKENQAQEAYIFNPTKLHSGSRPVSDKESNGLAIHQYNDGAVAALDKLKSGNGLFEFKYGLYGDNYYLQSYTSHQVDIDHILSTPSVTLAYHEAFHLYQEKHFQRPEYYQQLAFDKFNEYPINEEMLTLKLMVLERFKSLPIVNLDKEQVKQQLKEYVVLVDEMLRIDTSKVDDFKSGYIYKHALGQELYEGSAMMVDTLMSRDVLPLHKEKRFNVFEPTKLNEEQHGFIKLKNKQAVIDYFAFEMFYDSGSAIIWLLLEDGVDYKQFEKGLYPYDIAKQRVDISEQDAYYLLQELKNSEAWEAANKAAKKYMSLK